MHRAAVLSTSLSALRGWAGAALPRAGWGCLSFKSAQFSVFYLFKMKSSGLLGFVFWKRENNMAPGQEWSWPLFRCWSQETEPALGALVGMRPPNHCGNCQGQRSTSGCSRPPGCPCRAAESCWEVPKAASAVLSAPQEMPEKLSSPPRHLETVSTRNEARSAPGAPSPQPRGAGGVGQAGGAARLRHIQVPRALHMLH